jgi:hypothetical protein
MEAALFLTIAIGSDDLVKLANSRGRVVQAYLVGTNKVESGRLFIKNAAPDNLRSTGSRVYLQFE